MLQNQSDFTWIFFLEKSNLRAMCDPAIISDCVSEMARDVDVRDEIERSVHVYVRIRVRGIFFKS